MDFTRKNFHEIEVEREGYTFTVEVTYECMPYFCTHCLNIGHDVSACRWLYPRKDNDINVVKEKVVQGKKQVPPKRLEWVPLKDNASGIGSSADFQDRKQVPIPIVVEMQLEPTVSPQPQQQALAKEVPVQNNTSTEAIIALEATLQAKDVAAHTLDDDMAHQCSMPTETSPQENLITCDEPSITLQYINVTNDVVRNDLGEELQLILSPVTDKSLDVGRIVASPDAHVDPTLQKEVDFMNNWLAKASENDTPFMLVVSKSQKKEREQDVTIKPVPWVLFHLLSEYYFMQHSVNW